MQAVNICQWELSNSRWLDELSELFHFMRSNRKIVNIVTDPNDINWLFVWLLWSTMELMQFNLSFN